LERLAGAAFPASFTDEDALLIGTGCLPPTNPRPRMTAWSPMPARMARMSAKRESVG
jgi:hypothetical protein